MMVQIVSAIQYDGSVFLNQYYMILKGGKICKDPRHSMPTTLLLTYRLNFLLYDLVLVGLVVATSASNSAIIVCGAIKYYVRKVSATRSDVNRTRRVKNDVKQSLLRVRRRRVRQRAAE